MEIEREVKTVKVDYKCDTCNEGFMRPTGNVLTTYPPQIPHKCSNSGCNAIQTFSNISYPYIDYKPITKIEQNVK